MTENDFSEKDGYKAGEKPRYTRKAELLLVLCLVAIFTLPGFVTAQVVFSNLQKIRLDFVRGAARYRGHPVAILQRVDVKSVMEGESPLQLAAKRIEDGRGTDETIIPGDPAFSWPEKDFDPGIIATFQRLADSNRMKEHMKTMRMPSEAFRYFGLERDLWMVSHRGIFVFDGVRTTYTEWEDAEIQDAGTDGKNVWLLLQQDNDRLLQRYANGAWEPPVAVETEETCEESFGKRCACMKLKRLLAAPNGVLLFRYLEKSWEFARFDPQRPDDPLRYQPSGITEAEWKGFLDRGRPRILAFAEEDRRKASEFLPFQEVRVILHDLENDRWVSKWEMDLPAWIFPVSGFDAETPAGLLATRFRFPDGFESRWIDPDGHEDESGSEFKLLTDFGPLIGLAKNTLIWMAALQIFPVFVAFLFAFWISRMMARHREDRYVSAEGASVRFASIWRRALAQFIDAALLLILPLLVTAWATYAPPGFESARELLPFARFLGAMLVVLGSGILLLLLYSSVLEGLFGFTLGKWIMNIRVVKMDSLKPCGIGRAVLRNLLQLLDGLLHFIIGMAFAAFSRHWQRLGDMAAGTIVIRREEG